MTRVAYLGPSYSFTHLAAIERFGTSATFIPVNNIAAVFEEVNRGHADYGIAPIENSTDGRVVDTLDMFTRFAAEDLRGKCRLAIHHNLMSALPAERNHRDLQQAAGALTMPRLAEPQYAAVAG